MGKKISQSQDVGSPSQEAPSFGHLLAVWILVGWSLWSLGSDLVDVLPSVVPISQMGAGLLFGTVVVASFWVLGFRPSLLRSAGYFVVESVTRLFLLFAAVFLGFEVGPWQILSLQCVSIGFAAMLAFTAVGERGLEHLQFRLNALLKLPPSSERPDSG